MGSICILAIIANIGGSSPALSSLRPPCEVARTEGERLLRLEVAASEVVDSLATDREVALAVLREAAEGGPPRRPRSAELPPAILREGCFELWSSEVL